MYKVKRRLPSYNSPEVMSISSFMCPFMLFSGTQHTDFFKGFFTKLESYQTYYSDACFLLPKVYTLTFVQVSTYKSISFQQLHNIPLCEWL